MSEAVVLIAVLVAVAVAAVVIAHYFRLLPSRRSGRLRKRFGPEYDTTVAAARGNRAAAEEELEARLQRHRDLRVRTLTGAERDARTRAWTALQEGFVDDPPTAVHDARALVERIMADLGYPSAEGFEDRLRDLSVDHPHAVAGARRARLAEAPEQGADTERLREALVACRTLVDALLERPSPPHAGSAPTPARRPERPTPEATR
ncbi:hypothetical protein [Nocardiopsis sp. LOL_012]|uniref:hypothetical protein n=1 Tax=Nocardiopsis sp. LOL_012 TaxID=3345409 RepID=UPI003A8AAD0F